MSTTRESESITSDAGERPTLTGIRDQLQRRNRLTVRLGSDEVVLPKSLVQTLQQLIPLLLRGEQVTLMHASQALTTQEAAALLNVSRQYVVQLLNEGKIDHHLVGTHRRIYAHDLLRYKEARDADRRGKLARLIELTEDAGLYDNE